MSLGNVLGTIAPIAAGYFAPGFGASLGLGAGIGAGALAGAGIAALTGEDPLMGAVGGGLGGYGGGGMRGAADATKLAQAGNVSNATVNQGITQGINQGSSQFISPYTKAGTFGTQTASSALGNAGLPALTGGGTEAFAGGLGPNMGQVNSLAATQPNMGQVNAFQGYDVAGTGGYNPSALGRAGDSISGGVDSAKAAFNDTDTFFSELGDGDTTAGYMKAGLTALPVATAALTPEYEGGSYNDNPMNKYDPTRRLDLSMETGIDEALTKDTGLRLLAEGGYLDGGNVGDGMSDDIPATINGNQPAALADGEFVVPADVVSHLGNGSSNAGSRKLYEMMDEVRRARTGREQQGKEINAERYMPA